jgi:acyl-CoA dehydrogenase
MSILYDEGQKAIANEAKRVLEVRVLPGNLLPLLEITGQFDTAFWDTAKEQGWTGIAIPEEYGGLGLSLIELGIVALACGGVTSGAPFLTSSYGAARAVLDHGPDELKAQWLPKLAAGDAIGAIAFAEHQSPVPTKSVVNFSDGKLTGTKPSVAAAAHADIAIVLASDNGKPVLVAADVSGLSPKAFNTFDNSRCVADLVFNSTPASLLASGQAALNAALNILALQSVVTAHEQTGGAESLMFRARDYANTRRAFGQVIGSFQSVKHRIAEMYGLVEIARANAIHAAARESHSDFLKAAAAARLAASDAYDIAARDTVQVHGGIGVTWEAGLHLHMRRARTLANEQGNGLFWEDVLVDELTGEMT